MTTVAGGRGTVLRFSGFELDSERAELRRSDGQTLKLRPKTLEILRLLAGHAGHVLSKQQLMEAAWPNVHVGEDSLFQCIREIRAALGDDKRKMVRLVSGRGYLFEAQVTEAGVAEAEVSAVPAPPATAALDTAAIAAIGNAPAKHSFDVNRHRTIFAVVAGLAILIAVAAMWTWQPGLIAA